MKNVIVLCFFALVAVALGRPEDLYTDKYDNINVPEVISNPRLFNPYASCLVDEAKCTGAGNELKSHVKEALGNKCAKCTDVQKANVRLVMEHLINNKPEIWNKLCAKYDPSNKYTTMYENELKKVKAKSA